MAELRVCVAEIEQLVQVKDGLISGIFSGLFNSILADFRTFTNLTLQPCDSSGDMVDPVALTFDGCLGRVQRNQSDMQIPMVEFPVLAPGLDQGYVVMASQMVMASAYDSTALTKATDVMDAFHSFTDRVWQVSATVSWIITFLIFVNLLTRKMSSSLLKRVTQKQPVFLHAFQQSIDQVSTAIADKSILIFCQRRAKFGSGKY